MYVNWYNSLKELPLIAITYEGKLYSSIEDIKDEIDYSFDNGYGGTNGFSFTAWTEDRVYFPVQYDGAEWIESVPRIPCEETTDHLGGG